MATIPKIIHQIAFDDAPEKSSREWQRLHPDWEYRLWDAESLEELVSTHYPDWLDLYHTLDYDSQRLGLGKYLVLDHLGGLYADTNLYPYRPVDATLEKISEVAFVQGTVPGSISNAVMISKPKARIWEDVLAFLRHSCEHREWWRRGEDLHAEFSTGSEMLTRALNQTAETYLVLPRQRYNLNYTELVRIPSEAVLLPIEATESNTYNLACRYVGWIVISLIALLIIVSVVFYVFHRHTHVTLGR